MTLFLHFSLVFMLSIHIIKTIGMHPFKQLVFKKYHLEMLIIDITDDTVLVATWSRSNAAISYCLKRLHVERYGTTWRL